MNDTEPARDRTRVAVAVAALTAGFILLGSILAVLLPMFANYDEQTHIDRALLTSKDPFVKVDAELDRTFGSWGALLAVNEAMSADAVPWSAPAATRPDYLPFRDYPGGEEQQHAPCPGLCQNYQYTQPPAWYLITAPIVGALRSKPFPRTMLALRLFDVIVVGTVVPLAWWTAAQVWPRSRRRQIAVAALVASFGPLAFTAAGANNDALMLAAAAAVVALTTAILVNGNSRWRSVLLGAAASVGLLTKVEIVVLLPLAAVAILVAPRGPLSRVKAALIAGVLALPGIAWWISEQLGGGVLSPSDSQVIAKPGPGPWRSANLIGYAIGKLPTFVDRFWGLYGVPTFLPPPGWRLVLWIATGALAVAWALARRSSLSSRPPQWRYAVLAAAPVALSMSVLYASFKTYHLNGEVRGLAPRYLYPALAIFAMGAVAAVGEVRSRLGSFRRDRWVVPALIVSTALVAGAGSVVLIVHGMYGTRSVSLLVDRAGLVAPLAHPARVAAVLVVLWVAAIVVAAIATLERRGDQSSTM